MSNVAERVQVVEEPQTPEFDIDAVVAFEELTIDKGSVSAKAPGSAPREYTRVHYDNLASALANTKALYRTQPKGTKIRVNFVLTT